MTLDGVTGVAALNDLLDDYRVPPAARATILEAVAAAQADRVAVLGRTPPGGGYVTLSPPDGAIAAYVHPTKLSLVLDRRAAVRAAQQHEFCRVEEGEATSWVRLVMEQWAVQQHAVVVRNLVLAALKAAVPPPEPAPTTARLARPARTARAGARGARTSPGTAAKSPVDRPAPAPPAVCPVHFVQLVNGSCDYCDD